MNASEITFGIEIATTLPTGTLEIGPHGAGRDIPSLAGWKADRDPSIRTTPGREACEFVSPIYRGVWGLQQLIAAVRQIKALGATVNASCGIHIHVGFDKDNAAAMARLTTLVSNHEKAIFAATGTKNRERGRWCASVNQHGAADRAINASRFNRYHVLNIGTPRPTVEFRAFSSSLAPEKIVAYVRMCIGLAERALTAKRVTEWNARPVAQTSPIHRAGVGQTAVTRLFYQLGWTRGRQPHVHGNLAGEGLPAIANSKKVIIRLSRKYDAQP